MSEVTWREAEVTTPSRVPVSARGRRTRAKLIESGREALAERGPRDTRVDDVVRRAGTSHGTFYLYFENIEDLTSVVIEECDARATDLVGALRATAGAADLRAITRVVEGYGELHRRYGDIASPWVGPDGRSQSRLHQLTAELTIDRPAALAVLALLDRVAPEVDSGGASRLAQLVSVLLSTPPAPAP